MENNKPSFSILITTKNRRNELGFTLNKINYLLERNDVDCIICDDGSTDGTFEFVRNEYPNIQLIQNEKSKGLIYSRNRLLNLVTTEFAISLDDDAHFVTENPLELIKNYFYKTPNCGLVALRIFWGLQEPNSIASNENPQQVKGFVGCAHAWRMEAWRTIPNYPEWFIFYGEEDFAAFQLFKKGWEIHYLPEVLVNHRVDIKSRKKDSDYQLRLRRSLRSGWYLYFLFYPWQLVPKKSVYTLWIQLKTKVFKGDWKAGLGILQAIGDLIINIPRLIKQSNRLSIIEFKEFSKLAETKLYWKPEDE